MDFRRFRVAVVVAAAVLVVIVLAVACNNTESKTSGTALAMQSASPSRTSSPAARTSSPAARTSSLAARSSSPASDPSGVPVPTGNIPGWNLVYSQDFNGTALPTGWVAYSGQPGGDPDGYWNSANVTVNKGELHFRATANDDPKKRNTYSTGGVNFYGHPQTYGIYLVRLKSDYEPGLDIASLALLWPSGNNNVWPPEIDFFEESDGTPTNFSATLHPGPNGDDCCIIGDNFPSHAAYSITQWHTYGIEWTPTTITYTIDGHQWGTIINKSQLSTPAQWPSINMDLDLQSENLGPVQPAGPIESMTVDWVAEYAPSPR